MRLKRFRVRKYRNIQDSGDVELLENLTCIVGKNQSGKTALLRALHKFNPRQKTDVYDLRLDWPRGERRMKDENQVVCEATFVLTEEEKLALASLVAPERMEATEVLTTKNYKGEFEVRFPSHPGLFPNCLHPNEVDGLCQALPATQEPAESSGFAVAARACTEEVQRAVKEGRYEDLPSLLAAHVTRMNATRSAQNPQLQAENAFVATYTQKLN
jgi:hypothetical protein